MDMALTKYRLQDIADVEISGVDKKILDGETPIRLCNFTDVYYNWAITQEKAKSFLVASANTREINKFRLRKGMVALTKDSETRFDIGISTYIADDLEGVILGYHCALVTPLASSVNGKYLNAFISSSYIKQYCANSANGSGQRYSLPISVLKNMPILLPSIKEQQAIGNLLSLIDRKITLNRAINHNLDAMAKQLYDYWFVQFDFPDENGKPYKSSGGKMMWNEKLKREIPEGWNDGILSDVSEIKSGFPFKSEKYTTNGQYGIITIKNVQDHRLELFPMDKIDSKPSKLPSYCDLKVGNCLISLTGNVGRICRVYKGNLLLNQRVGVIVTNNNSPEWVYQLFDDKSIYKQVQSLSNGAAQANVSPIDIGKIQMVIPPKDILIHFEKRINGVYSTFIRNEREVLELTKLRNELLPLLMNGQVSVNYDLSHD